MSSTYISDHITRAKIRLIEQYKGKPKVEGVIEALVKPLQEIEDVLQQLKTERWVDSAVGVQLDKIGEIVGMEREYEQGDEDYRLLIKAKIIMNLNQGTPEEVIAAAKFFIGAIFIWYFIPLPSIYFHRPSCPKKIAQKSELNSKNSYPQGCHWIRSVNSTKKTLLFLAAELASVM
jgi:hypothetical protein